MREKDSDSVFRGAQAPGRAKQCGEQITPGVEQPGWLLRWGLYRLRIRAAQCRDHAQGDEPGADDERCTGELDRGGSARRQAAVSRTPRSMAKSSAVG